MVYVNQLTESANHYVKSDLKGESNWLASTTKMLKELIKSSMQAT